ncbi:hypothetical protein PIB30_111331, partial [Stylosanthes scabra]|nr:hypothetical protein [Stylosanthes scabra]
MPRMKKTQKRSREGESSVESPPSNHPLAKWFHANEDLIFYELRLAGRKEIPPSRLASIWKLPLDGCLFEGGKVPLEDWGYDKMRAMEMFNLTQNEKSKIPCQTMNDEYRILLYLVTYVLEPRVSGHGNVAVEDLVLMWAM